MDLGSNITYKPNFLIVGAAKSGTTSLAKYLDEHPDIYISKVKEPRFLISNTIKSISKKDPSYKHLTSNSILKLKDYLALFRNRKEKALGEASIHYLYHKEEAVENIKKYLGTDVKIIVLLRSPVFRAISNWKYQDKDFLDFRSAVKNEQRRKKEGFNSFWFYTSLGFYYNQIKFYMDNFNHVQVVLFEDFIKNTYVVMKNLYSFLDVDYNYENINFDKHNANTLTVVPKSKFLKSRINSQKRVNVFKDLVSMRIVPKTLYFDKKDMYSDDDISYLKKLYEEDIKKLQKLINQDLSNWL